jgi:3-hydroxyacyl-CoA dehydrogenase / enoyl-CoA hydratase / 3-hydroxybutyryl-CoA epimerase
MITWDRHDDGVVVLTLDDPSRSANAMNMGYLRAMASTVDRLEVERESITGVVVTSAKDSFLVGMDLAELSEATDPVATDPVATDPVATDLAGIVALATTVKDQFRRLEKLGRPVVAALNGSALGGGMELALACHHRIAVDNPAARFGLPEVTLGLLPGGGGVTRVVRLLGIQDGLTNVLLKGQRMRPGKAVSAGIVDELAPDREAMLVRAIEWIRANPDAAQPWDRPGYRIPGGRPSDLAMLLPALPANLRKQLKGAHYPAAHHIMCAAVEGAAVDFDTALRIEGRWFADLLGTQIQRNMTKAFFFDLQHLNRGGSRPVVREVPKPVDRVAVIGAGMMGSGIAQSCARAGLYVVVVDVTRALAERAATDRRITPTDSLDDIAGCDAVIEAVFEDLALKHETFGKVCGIVGPDTLIASNTSSLPITSLAEAVDRPERFLGLHFFSPVDRMPLVEIIRGKSTSDEALARGYDLVRRLDKTPIVVNDSRGFFTSRIFGARVMEGVTMLAEGVPAASIEQAALQAGYPVGPLAVLDEVSLSLGRRLRAEARKAQPGLPVHPGEAVIERMVVEFGRAGKAAGAGFYDYDLQPKRLWPGLAAHFGGEARLSFVDIQERMLFAEAIEAVKCVDEGVLTGIPDGNIGSIFGIGFPAWTGGVLQYIDQYPIERFVARAVELARRYGDRFTPPESLTARARTG